MTDKQKQMMEALRVLKDHCLPLDNCEGCELEEVCDCLFCQEVEDWKLD